MCFKFMVKIMFHKNYRNFVRAASPIEHVNKWPGKVTLSGKEAKRIYLEEVGKSKDSVGSRSVNNNLSANIDPKTLLHGSTPSQHDIRAITQNVCDKDLFLAAQNNNLQIIKDAIGAYPDKINVTDDYGWSLLMIACQAGSIDTVKELLKRGADITLRDKAGNSAQSLVIRNKNLILANMLVTHKQNEEEQFKRNKTVKHKDKTNEFHCTICNRVYPNEQEHLASTVHNLNISKGKRIPTHYAISQNNRGYQIMLKVGWDRESGLGPNGVGKMYPIKAVQKKDRKGLGHIKKEFEVGKKEKVNHRNRKSTATEFENNRKMEINFRRQFY